MTENNTRQPIAVEPIEDADGENPSNQKGGCDYVSFTEARKIFANYVGQELRDPNGMNNVAKAMCAYDRMVSALTKQKEG